MPINLAGAGEALDGSLPTIFSEFKLLRDETGVMRSTATRMDLTAHEGASKNVNNYGRVIAYDVADGVDITQAQSLADTTTTYTPGEVAVQVILAGSTMRRVQDPQLLERTGKMLNNAYDLKEDSDGCAQLSSFVPLMGAANDIIGPGMVTGAAARLGIGNDRANPEPAPKPWFTVLHPLQAHELLARIVPFTDLPGGNDGAAVHVPTTGATNDTIAGGSPGQMGEAFLRRGIGSLGTYAGTTVKLDANISVDATDDASGACFSQEGLNFVSEVEPTFAPDDSDKSLRGAVELNLWGSYVWGLYRSSNYGVELLFDASLPTS